MRISQWSRAFTCAALALTASSIPAHSHAQRGAASSARTASQRPHRNVAVDGSGTTAGLSDDCDDSAWGGIERTWAASAAQQRLAVGRIFRASRGRATRVVQYPTVNYSFYPAFVEYPGSTSLRMETARDMIVDIIRGIARHGPKRFYVLNTGVSTLRALAPRATRSPRVASSWCTRTS